MTKEDKLNVLKTIPRTITQKHLATELGYSVGKVNYVLRELIAKGLAKADKFISSDNKLQYKYLLTEQGIKEKIRLTEKFIAKKKKEFNELQTELEMYKKYEIKKENKCQQTK